MSCIDTKIWTWLEIYVLYVLKVIPKLKANVNYLKLVVGFLWFISRFNNLCLFLFLYPVFSFQSRFNSLTLFPNISISPFFSSWNKNSEFNLLCSTFLLTITSNRIVVNLKTFSLRSGARKRCPCLPWTHVFSINFLTTCTGGREEYSIIVIAQRKYNQ